MTSIWWIRRDLRLTDTAPLQASLEAGSVLPVFILDPAFDNQSARRRNFLYEALASLDKDLRAHGSYLVIRRGRPVDVLRQIFDETKAETIHAEEDYTPYARSRDALIQKLLPLKLVPGQTVHHPKSVLKQDGRPYTVYTPYSKLWKAQLGRLKLPPAPGLISTPGGIPAEPLPDQTPNPTFRASEQEALTRLEEFTYKRIHAYADDRNRMDLDGTSSLSPYLRFGMLGLRQVVNTAVEAQRSSRGSKGAEIWLNELIWREFYIQILYHFPHVAKTSFNPALANIPWRNSQPGWRLTSS